jgi:dihydroflavonol-4-reductase
MKGEKVLVTGGNGHLGNTLAKALAQRGYQVRVTVRDPDELGKHGIFDGHRIEVMTADIRNQPEVERAVEGVTGVFQVAALYNFDDRGHADGIVANNVEGSQTVLKAAAAKRVKRVVMTSSVMAVGFGGSEAEPMTEEAWNNPNDPYCRSKVASEKAAWAFAKEHGMDLVTVCPGLILGPNFYKHTASTINVSVFINNQVPFRFPFHPSIVDVRDVAEAHILAYENPKAAGRYLASGHHVQDFVAALAEQDPDMVLPGRLLNYDEARKFSEKAGTSTEMVGRSFRFSDAKLRTELGWRPRPLPETLATTIQWIKERRM